MLACLQFTICIHSVKYFECVNVCLLSTYLLHQQQSRNYFSLINTLTFPLKMHNKCVRLNQTNTQICRKMSGDLLYNIELIASAPKIL